MLASAETADVVAGTMTKYNPSLMVVDPVMVSTSGSQLLPHDALHIYMRQILPLTTILTPNIPEARLLLQEAGVDVPDLQHGNIQQALVNVARGLRKLGPRNVLLKGGHMPLEENLATASQELTGAVIVDVLCHGNKVTLYKSKYRESRNTHGTV